MDQLSAHLDRGWDLVKKGDLRGARSSARRALETEPDSPEAHNLLGYVAAQEGDADEALEHYRQAMALDDGYIDPMLNAAEVLIHPLQEYDEALMLCDEVLDFAEGAEETADALLLKFDALLGKGERDAARRVLDDLPEGLTENPTYPFLIGRAWFEVGEIDKAEHYLRAAIQNDPRNPDAQYYMGLVLDARGDVRGATIALLESRELELHLEPLPWSPPRNQFQKAVERGIAQLEPDLLQHIRDALVLVTDMPGIEMIADGVDPRAPVLLDGIAEPGEPGPLAQRVFIYQRNIERLCGGIEQLDDEIAFQLAEEIRHTLEHRDRNEDDTKRPTPRAQSSELSRGGRERERDKPAEVDESKNPPRPRNGR